MKAIVWSFSDHYSCACGYVVRNVRGRYSKERKPVFPWLALIPKRKNVYDIVTCSIDDVLHRFKQLHIHILTDMIP